MAEKIPRYKLPTSWRELRFFASYRLFLAISLFVAHNLTAVPHFLGQALPELYDSTSLIYIVLACILFVMTFQQWGSFKRQTIIQMLLDIVFITLFIHASGGLETGLGSLLVVVIVVSGAIIPGKMAIFISAIASLAVLFQAGYSQIVGIGVSEYSHAGMLGAALFITALLSQTLSGKLLENYLLVEQRERDVKKLAMLNEHIISRMQTGVVVVAPSGEIQLSNDASHRLLGPITASSTPPVLALWCPLLAKQLSAWLQYTSPSFQPFQANSELPQVLASAIRLHSGDVVIYIEDTSSTAQQVQQLKLASLGRLTASIAHEIRNPLGAISHAGELLAERNPDDLQSKKLTNIIERHSMRLNGIIDTILTMSRRNKVEPKMVVLAPWLGQFVDEFVEYYGIDKDNIKLTITASLATVFIDPQQLHQIILNLVDNAWHYSRDDNEQYPRIELVLAIIKNNVVIDVIDNGPGVDESSLEQLFEPFYSQRTGGTGLGLYLARELAQANGAWLNYFPDNQQRSCFRMVIPMKARENLA